MQKSSPTVFVPPLMQQVNSTKHSKMMMQPEEKENDCEMSKFVPDSENTNGRGSGQHQELLAIVHLHRFLGDAHEHRLQDVRQNRLLIYVFLIVLYIGLNAALLGANFKSQDFIELFYFSSFHLTAFWSVFGFTLLEAFILISTDILSWSNKLQTLLVLFNVMSTFATATLFTFDPHEFEVPAHYMEYTVQILISGVNIIFLQSYMNRNGDPESMVYKLRYLEMTVALLVLGLSMLTLVLYTGVIPLKIESERAAHFCEFTNEIFNGIFALAYAISCFTDVRNKLEKNRMGMVKSTSVNYFESVP
jgi:hypothetical protein